MLDGLYDPNSPISKLLGVSREVVGEIFGRSWWRTGRSFLVSFPDPLAF